MAAVVNLHKFLRRQAREAAERLAAENRAVHGQSKDERGRTARERQRADKMLDDSKIED
jgi:Domain of unknown function (DUF4169)